MKIERSTARLLLVVFSGFLSMMLLAPSASAQDQEAGFRGRLWVGTVGRYVLKDNDPFTVPGLATVGLKVDGSAPGVGGDVEYRLNRWFGIDGALAYTKLNVDFTTSLAPGTKSRQRLGVLPLLLAFNVHVIDIKRVDVWLGPQIGYVMFPNDLSYSAGGLGTFQYKPKNTFSKEGFVVGTDIRINKTWAINSAFRWQDADGDSNGNLTIDPAMLTIGVTKRF